MQIARQRFKLRVWITSRLWAQVIAGMVLGFGLGLLLSEGTGLVEPEMAELVGLWLALPGQIFLGLIAMVLVPLIFSSIVGGLAGAGSGEALRAVGLRLAGFILLTTAAAASLGVVLALWLQPGAGIAGLSAEAPPAAVVQAAEADTGTEAEVAARPIDRTAKLYIGGKQKRPDGGYSLLATDAPCRFPFAPRR